MMTCLTLQAGECCQACQASQGGWGWRWSTGPHRRPQQLDLDALQAVQLREESWAVSNTKVALLWLHSSQYGASDGCCRVLC